MRIKNLHCCAFIVFLSLYVFRVPVYGTAIRYSDEERIICRHQGIDLKGDYREYANSSHLLKWDIEVDKMVFQIHVNTHDETITVRGHAENLELEEKVKKIVNMRAPTNYRIIYQISINKNSNKG